LTTNYDGSAAQGAGQNSSKMLPNKNDSTFQLGKYSSERIRRADENRDRLIQSILESDLPYEQKKELTNMSDNQMVIMRDYLHRKHDAQEQEEKVIDHDYSIAQVNRKQSEKWRSSVLH